MRFDPLYLILLGPSLVLTVYALCRVLLAFAWANQIQARCGMTGADTAATLLRAAGMQGVAIQFSSGFLANHYVISRHVLGLSPQVSSGRSLAALGITAHESAHALQEAAHYPLLGIRTSLVPTASIGGTVAWLFVIAGLLSSNIDLIYIGIIFFSITVFLQVICLPVEFDASRRARRALISAGLVTPEEDPVVARVLHAAALTYLAAALTGLLPFLVQRIHAEKKGGKIS